MEKMDSFLEAPFWRQVVSFKGVWNRNFQEAVHPTCCSPLASAVAGHLSFMRKTSPTATEVEQKNWGICMHLGCFVGASKLKLLWLHCWESCITLPDCYYIRLPQIHPYTLLQASSSISESYLCCLERPGIWIHTHQLPSLYLQSVPIPYPPHCAWRRHLASTLLPHVKTAFAWKPHFPQLHTERNEQTKELLQKENHFGI